MLFYRNKEKLEGYKPPRRSFKDWWWHNSETAIYSSMVIMVLMSLVGIGVGSISDNTTYQYIIPMPDDKVLLSWYLDQGWETISSPDGKQVYLYLYEVLDDDDENLEDYTVPPEKKE